MTLAEWEHQRVRLLARIADAAQDISDGMTETAGGDAFEFSGSMNDVEDLRERLKNYSDFRFMQKKPRA